MISFPARSDEDAGFDIAAGVDTAAGAGTRPKLLLRRLPVDAELAPRLENVIVADTIPGGAEAPLTRPEGSRDARQKGSVVHALLEQFSGGVALESLRIPAGSLLRAFAFSGKALEDSVEEVLAAVRNCVNDPDGAWILAPHPQAQSEASWTGWNDGALETLRADRVFVAGNAPRVSGEDHLWIVDYKMSAPAGNADFLAHQREVYAPQLARYARALREAEGSGLAVCFGLYYPRIALLDWWCEGEP